MPDEVVQTPFGKFQVNPEECIGGTVKAGTVWDGPGFLQVIAREHGQLGTWGVTILDVGAHLGDWTVWLVREGAWRVVAVEAAPYMIQMFKANMDLNKDVCADRVMLLPYAAYDRTATLTWDQPYVERDAGGAALTLGEEHGAIPARALDDFQWAYGERVSLIKIDVQGCDFRALLGLEQTITRDHPVIVFEWEPRLMAYHGDTLEETIAWLEARRYTVQPWPSHEPNYLALPR
jgi:FkbM family methyltransferase